MASPIDETLNLVQNYVRVTWRFRWLALVVAAFVCAIGWAIVVAMPNQYAVSAKVYLDTQSILRPLLRGLAVDANPEAQAISVISRTLLVRPNLEAVVRKTDMDLNVTTPAELEQLINGLRKRVKIRRTKRSNIFAISYTDSSPRQAYRVVEALLNIFVERSLGESRKDSSSSRQFIDGQIKEYEARLSAAEARLKEFKRQNVGMMPADGRTYYRRLEDINNKVATAKLAQEEALRRVAILEDQIANVPPTYKPEGGPDRARAERLAVETIQRRINDLLRTVDGLLLQYTDRHPDVTAARSVVTALEKERETALVALQLREEAIAKGLVDEGDVDASSPNPLYQELRVSLGSSRAEVAALEARVEEYTNRQVKLTNLVDTIPKIEAELRRLNRDYGIDKDNYSKLVQRREALKISDDASQTTDDVRFNVIEPPREPLLPVSPNRQALSGGVLGAGLAVGVGLAFLIGLLKPAFYTTEDFQTATRLPVLGVVSRIWTKRELLRRRMEVMTFAAGCVALLAAFGGIVVLHTVYVDIMGEFDIAARVADLKARLL